LFRTLGGHIPRQVAEFNLPQVVEDPAIAH
jgi:hypothetical protein